MPVEAGAFPKPYWATRCRRSLCQETRPRTGRVVPCPMRGRCTLVEGGRLPDGGERLGSARSSFSSATQKPVTADAYQTQRLTAFLS